MNAVKFQLEEKCKLGSTTDIWVLGQSISELYPDSLKTRTECMTALLIECKDLSNLGLLVRSGKSTMENAAYSRDVSSDRQLWVDGCILVAANINVH